MKQMYDDVWAVVNKETNEVLEISLARAAARKNAGWYREVHSDKAKNIVVRRCYICVAARR